MNSPRYQMLSRPGAVNVAHVVERCRVLGPGERFVLWTQGCPLRCPECHNPGFLAFRDATWIGVDALAERIKVVQGVEGVTFVGGEPFAQARALATVSRMIRAAGRSVMVYTGFTYEQLLSEAVPDARLLLDSCDLLMDGPYVKDLPTQRPWRGSDNQRLIALSPRYADLVKEWNEPTGQTFEVRVREDGTLEVLGIPPLDLAEPLPCGMPGETIASVPEMARVIPGSEDLSRGRSARPVCGQADASRVDDNQDS